MTERHISLAEWETAGPDHLKHGGVLQNYRFPTSEARKIATELTRSRLIEFVESHHGLQIRARSHVGRVQLGDLTVTVTPKIAAQDLLSLFRYAYQLKDVRRETTARYSVSGNLFQDLLITQLLAEVHQLLQRGLARNYTPHHDLLTSPRGKIDFARIAAAGQLEAGVLPCRHYLRSADQLLNQVVLAGVHFARGLAHDRALVSDLAGIARMLGEYAHRVQLSSALLNKADRALNRLVAPYASIIRLVGILYGGSFLQIEEIGDGLRIPGFLFDMNRFFQNLLGRFLSENLPDFEVKAEHTLSEMMRYVPGFNPGNRLSPRPRPDYAITRRRAVVALLDAKYRDLWNASLPREMLYQLCVYALSQPTGSTAAILYPAATAAATLAVIEIREPLTARAAGFVALRPVLLPKLVGLIENKGQQGQRPREVYARQLAGVG